MKKLLITVLLITILPILLIPFLLNREEYAVNIQVINKCSSVLTVELPETSYMAIKDIEVNKGDNIKLSYTIKNNDKLIIDYKHFSFVFTEDSNHQELFFEVKKGKKLIIEKKLIGKIYEEFQLTKNKIVINGSVNPLNKSADISIANIAY